MLISTGNRNDSVGNNLFWSVCVKVPRIRGPIAQLIPIIITHHPKAAVRPYEKTVFGSCRNRNDVVGVNSLRPDYVVRGGAIRCSVTQLTGPVPTHTPKTAIGPLKKTVPISCDNSGDGLA